jgi:hypothetical protein
MSSWSCHHHHHFQWIWINDIITRRWVSRAQTDMCTHPGMLHRHPKHRAFAMLVGTTSTSLLVTVSALLHLTRDPSTVLAS